MGNRGSTVDDGVDAGWRVSALNGLGAAVPWSEPGVPSATIGPVLSALQPEGMSGDGGLLAIAALEVDGLAVSVASELGVRSVAWHTDPVAAQLEDLHTRFAEGPGADALVYATTVAAPDLAGVAGRWPGFASAALDLGVGAVFTFPIHVGFIPVAAVLAHRAEPGALSASARRDARV